MQRKQLLGVRRRAERAAKAASSSPKSGLAGGTVGEKPGSDPEPRG